MSARDEYALPAAVGEPPAKIGHVTPDEEFDRGLPVALDAERTLLGSVLLDNKSFNDISETLQPEDFALQAHQRVFRRMGELIDAGVAVDIVTLAEELSRHKEIESVGGVAWIASLTEGLPRRLAVEPWVKIVQQKAQLRRIITLASNAITRCADQSETPLPILEDLEANLLEIAQQAQTGALRTVAQSVEAAGGFDPYLKAATDPEQKPGLPTGFTDYDRLTGGLQKQELTIIAARPSMGKTGLALNIAQNVTRNSDAIVAVFSLEMSRDALERRMMASESRVNVRKAMTGEWISNTERDKMKAALETIIEQRIFIDDSAALTPTQLRAKARRLKQRMGRLDLLIVDYLQLMNVPGKPRQEEVAAVSRSLKQCAKELDCPVIALAQLNRKSEERTDRRPMLSDLRESGQIEQDADVVAFVHRDSYYHPEDPDLTNLAEVILAKQRNGPTGIVKLIYVPDFVLFGNPAYGD